MSKNRNLACVLIALLASASSGQQQWTVDDDGPADFAEIADAIVSPLVTAGDVLLVHPGDYADFFLNKELDVLAPAGATFFASTCTVQNAPAFTLAGMRVDNLFVRNVTGRGRIDDCRIGRIEIDLSTGFPFWTGRCEVESCSQLVITRTVFHGREVCYPDRFKSYPALDVRSSTVAIADCELWGGSDDLCEAHPSDGPFAGLEVLDGSDVTVAGSTMIGGQGVASLGFEGAPGLCVVDSTVRVRGNSSDALVGGSGASGLAPPVGGGGGGGGAGTAAATVSGVALGPGALPPWVVVESPARPFLQVTGADAPGTTKTIEIYGPAGQRGFLAGALVPGLVPGYFAGLPGESVWLEPASIVLSKPKVLVGQETPATLPVALPGSPGLAGAALVLQVYFPPLPGQPESLANPFDVVARW